jgi:glycosyltransferase involved in cell wall biosynthesis
MNTHLTERANGYEVQEQFISSPIGGAAKANRVTASDQDETIAVIAAYNEERFIGSVVLSALRHVRKVFVVDDGSTDDTVLIASAAGATVVELEQNRGKGAALRVGLEVALQEEGVQSIVLLDGDGQHDPDEIPAIAQPVLVQKAELTIGSRFLEIHSQIPWWRRIGQHSLTWMTNVASNVPLTDSQSGFRCISPQVAKLMLLATSNGFSIESEMQFLIKEYGITTLEVPIGCVYEEPSKRNPFKHGLQVIDGILRIAGAMRPLLFFCVPATIILLGGLISGFYVVDLYERTNELAVGYALVTLLLIIVGTIGFSSGVILHSIRALLISLRQGH